jgi:hypothetical protein
MTMTDTEGHARSETNRKTAVIGWARQVLEMIGLTARISQATLHELRSITFNAEDAEIAMAIRDALFPPGGGKPADHFTGLREGALKQILKGRFDELKRDRETELQTGRRTAAPAENEDENEGGKRPEDNVANFVSTVLGRFLHLTVDQFVTVTLWILHTHVYDRFVVSPRLMATSPVRGCGKTTLLDICEQLTARGYRTDSITAAAIARLVHQEHCTLLADEADNLDVEANRLMKAILNGGHRRGAKRVQVNSKGELTAFSIFGPMAFAAIGMLPLPLMHRSVVIEMTRATRELERFDPANVVVQLELGAVFREIRRWAQSAELSNDPPLPKALRNRPRDNWSVLISIADSISLDWGEMARKAAIALSKDRPDEDPGVRLLTDIRDIFARRRVDRITSEDLVKELIALDSLWSDQQSRKLTQGVLSRLLSPGFKITTQTIWPLGSRATRGKSRRGYYKAQFAEAWSAYCESDTPTHGDKSKPNSKHLGLKKPKR